MFTFISIIYNNQNNYKYMQCISDCIETRLYNYTMYRVVRHGRVILVMTLSVIEGEAAQKALKLSEKSKWMVELISS